MELFLHTEVRWLSRGKDLDRVFELRSEIADFLAAKAYPENTAFHDEHFIACLTYVYLSEIFQEMNVLNCSLLGEHSSIIDFRDKMNAFYQQMELWHRRANVNNVAMFTRLDQFLQSSEVQCLATEIGDHLLTLKTLMATYFPERKALQRKTAYIQQPFLAGEDVISDTNPAKDEFLKLRNEFVTHSTFDTVEGIASFWLQEGAMGYPTLMTRAVDVLLPFSTTYICVNLGSRQCTTSSPRLETDSVKDKTTHPNSGVDKTTSSISLRLSL